jgi:Flp pilus assembly pilin Flp
MPAAGAPDFAEKRRESMKQLWKQEEGQELVEYVLIVVLVALGAAATFPGLVTALTAAFNNGSTCLNSVTSC